MANYMFGKASNKQLSTIHPSLQCVCRKALKYGVMDATAVEGRRTRARQDRLFRLGKSKVKWPDSNHNIIDPDTFAHAIDIVPYVNGKASWNWNHCLVWAGLMLAAAAELGVGIRWGGCWSGNPSDIGRQKFEDLAHFELKGK